MCNPRKAVGANSCSTMEQKPFQKQRSLKSQKNRINLGISKLFFVVLTLVAINTTAFSQDVIITKDSKKIEAKVTEININSIKYKKFNNLEGPTYTLLKSEIATIVYQNGMIDVFDEKEREPVPEKNNLFPYKNGLVQDKMKNEFYDIGTDDDRMLDFLNKNDISKYKEFAAACKQRNRGGTLLGSGLALTLEGIIFYGILGTESEFFAGIGVVSLIVGEVFIIVSIPISASAGARKNAIKEDFEQQYFSNKKYSYQPTLNFGFTQGGLGFTLNF
jgi:hypothetical protein